MKCAGCGGDFESTWQRYAKAPFGSLICPLCDARLVGKHRWFYWVLMPFAVAVAVVPFMLLVFFFCYGPVVSIAVGVFVALLIVLPFDKYLESRFSVLVVDR